MDPIRPRIPRRGASAAGVAMTGAPALALALVLQVPSARAQDVLRIDELRQDVAELRRELAAQSRRIDVLERELAAARAGMSSRAPRAAARGAADPPPWLDASRWERVQPGMAETEVVNLLGPPNATRRGDDGSLTLLYALELSGSGYLGGRVVLRSGRVSEIAGPRLR